MKSWPWFLVALILLPWLFVVSSHINQKVMAHRRASGCACAVSFEGGYTPGHEPPSATGVIECGLENAEEGVCEKPNCPTSEPCTGTWKVSRFGENAVDYRVEKGRYAGPGDPVPPGTIIWRLVGAGVGTAVQISGPFSLECGNTLPVRFTIKFDGTEEYTEVWFGLVACEDC